MHLNPNFQPKGKQWSPKTQYQLLKKTDSYRHQPPVIESKRWFSWIKPIIKIPDDILLEQIGCDALLYIRFVRLLRRLLLIMSIIGIFVLIPINIVATRTTGDWPPASGSIEILPIAGINLQNGKLRADPNLDWYWSPFAATWLFSLLIAYFMYRASCDYINMRQYFFRLPENEISMKSLMVSGIPASMRSDEKLKEWIQSTKAIQYPIKDTMIGHHSSKLSELFEKHEIAVKQLEITLASYLSGTFNKRMRCD
jgi:calcium permeable stress-gated cation channel